MPQMVSLPIKYFNLLFQHNKTSALKTKKKKIIVEISEQFFEPQHSKIFILFLFSCSDDIPI